MPPIPPFDTFWGNQKQPLIQGESLAFGGFGVPCLGWNTIPLQEPHGPQRLGLVSTGSSRTWAKKNRQKMAFLQRILEKPWTLTLNHGLSQCNLVAQDPARAPAASTGPRRRPWAATMAGWCKGHRGAAGTWSSGVSLQYTCDSSWRSTLPCSLSKMAKLDLS